MAARKPPERARFASFTDLIAGLSDDQIAAVLADMPLADLKSAEHDWRNWRHDGQRAPDADDWRTWVIMAGRGFGKTRAGAEWVKAAVRASARAGAAPPRIALVAATIEEARRIMIHGNSGLLKVAAPLIDKWQSTGPTLHFKGGAQATLFSGANPEGLRGPEHEIAWCDELAKWEKAGETWDMLQLGMRLGDRPQVLVTTTPRAGSVLKRIMKAKGTVTTGGHSRTNLHLPKAFLEAVEELYGGTRLGRQELDGELLSDTPGALWNENLLERCRVNPPHSWGGGPPCSGGGGGSANTPEFEEFDTPLHHPADGPPPHKWGGFTKTVIGVDPPSGPGTCGIVACARDERGHLHVLADHSVTGASPGEWAAKVARAAEAHGADYAVAETNQGGAMVKEVLNGADAGLRVKSVTAQIGKSARATPVAGRFEAGKPGSTANSPSSKPSSAASSKAAATNRRGKRARTAPNPPTAPTPWSGR